MINLLSDQRMQTSPLGFERMERILVREMFKFCLFLCIIGIMCTSPSQTGGNGSPLAFSPCSEENLARGVTVVYFSYENLIYKKHEL